MGGAESPLQLRGFLFRMFIDKHIIGAPKLIRYILDGNDLNLSDENAIILDVNNKIISGINLLKAVVETGRVQKFKVYKY